MLPLLYADIADVAPRDTASVASKMGATVEAVPAKTAPKIDGRLTDEAWKLAKATTRFTQKFPNEGQAPRDETTLRVLYDESYVYVGVECRQKSAPIVARMARRDRRVEADNVTVALDTKGDGKSAFEFSVNAAGVLSDRLFYNDNEHDDYAWDEVWNGASALSDDGWSAEFAIPLRALRFESRAVSTWGIQVRRYTSNHQETDELAFIPRDVAGEVSHYGKLTGLKGLKSRQSVELRPFVVAKYTSASATAETLGENTPAATVGMDIKWHPSQRLTLDATFNPDFAQVEADRVVFNLTNVEIELPEKRPFFLEASDTYVTPMRALYTRRLGRIAPSVPALGTNERLVSAPTPAPLYGAAKLTGQLTDRTHVGTLSVLGGENAVRVAGPGVRREVALEPTSAYQVVRLKRDLGANAHVGMIFTSATRAEGTSRYARMADDPQKVICPQGDAVLAGARCFHDAFTGGLDARWRSNGGAYVASAQVLGTLRKNGPARTIADGTEMRDGDKDVGAAVRLAKEGGNWVGSLLYEGRGKRLDYNAVGFMPRPNEHRVETKAGYRWLAPWKFIQQGEANFQTYFRRTMDGMSLGDNYELNGYVQFKNFWEIYGEVHWRPARFDDREVGDGTALERRGVLGVELYAGTDPRKVLLLQAYQKTQFLNGGYFIEGDALIGIRALAALDLEIGPIWTFASGEPRYVERDGRMLTFGSLNAKSVGGTLRATYVFTPRLTIQSFAQVILNAGHYGPFFSFDAGSANAAPRVTVNTLTPFAGPAFNPDFQEAALNVSFVARWEFNLGSTLYLVYSRAQLPNVELGPTEKARLDFGGIQRAPATDLFLAKLAVFFG